MLMFFGILGFLQTTILPALLIIRLFRLKGGLTEKLLRLFPLSLIANYLVIFALAALHLYTRRVVLVLIGLEITAILWIFRKSLFRS